jgi:hypothetical protein
MSIVNLNTFFFILYNYIIFVCKYDDGDRIRENNLNLANSWTLGHSGQIQCNAIQCVVKDICLFLCFALFLANLLLLLLFLLLFEKIGKQVKLNDDAG